MYLTGSNGVVISSSLILNFDPSTTKMDLVAEVTEDAFSEKRIEFNDYFNWQNYGDWSTKC